MILWQVSFGASRNGTDLIFLLTGLAELLQVQFPVRSYNLKFTLTGTFTGGGAMRITLGGKQIAITAPGVKEFNIISLGEPGARVEMIAGEYSGGIDNITINGVDPTEFIVAAALPTDFTLQGAVLEATGGETLQEGLGLWFSQTADETIQGAEHRWLLEQAGVVDGTINGMWIQYLRSLALTGTIADMKLSYWRAQV